jgi:hypothetical protein
MNFSSNFSENLKEIRIDLLNVNFPTSLKKKKKTKVRRKKNNKKVKIDVIQVEVNQSV